jgi:hypothetical protein
VADPTDIRFVMLSPIPLVVRADFISKADGENTVTVCVVSSCDYDHGSLNGPISGSWQSDSFVV